MDIVEFFQEHDEDDLRGILDEAVAPDDHSEFEDVFHGDQKPDPDGTLSGDIMGSSGSKKAGSKQSVPFDLDIYWFVSG